MPRASPLVFLPRPLGKSPRLITISRKELRQSRARQEQSADKTNARRYTQLPAHQSRTRRHDRVLSTRRTHTPTHMRARCQHRRFFREISILRLFGQNGEGDRGVHGLFIAGEVRIDTAAPVHVCSRSLLSKYTIMSPIIHKVVASPAAGRAFS